MSLNIIKIGGSLMGSAELSSWLNSIESAAKTSNIVIVPGGGVFADSVRNLQKIHQFNDVVAHQMALLAMCQFGYLISDINSSIKIINNPEQILSSSGKQLPLLWLPMSLMEDFSEIKPSWDFTSDSIALWLATKLSAQKLILVKSKQLNSDNDQIRDYINNGDLDKGFQQLSENYLGKICFMDKAQHQKIDFI